MLGLTLTEQQWSWNACGKHPVAKDFIRLGQTFPLSIGMADWVDKGYSAVKGALKTGRHSCFWRFWARGTADGELACGVLRDSSDSIGREYPFLVVGSGLVPAWEENWDLIPGACEGVWSRIEYLCTRNSPDLAGLERELAATRPPEPDWRDSRATDEAGMKVPGRLPPFELIDAGLKMSQHEQEFHMALEAGMSDHLIRVRHLLNRIRVSGKGVPNIVFLGGTYDSTALVMYWRPLVVSDFIALWE